MKNGTMLYRCPGDEEFEGVKCATLIVEAEEVEAAKADGWHGDWMQAKAAHDTAQVAALEAEQAELAAKIGANPQTGLQAVHKGRGKYDVLDALGAVVASGLTKDEAAAKVAG